MNILPGLLNQTCVYWPPIAINKFGEYSPGEPVELQCQWVNKRSSVTSGDGRTLIVSAKVFLPVEVEEEGWLWLGSFEDRPEAPSNETRIQVVDAMQDVDNFEKLWTAQV